MQAKALCFGGIIEFSYNISPLHIGEIFFYQIKYNLLLLRIS